MTKEWFAPSELVGLPGLPDAVNNIRATAKRHNWKVRPRVGRGGGNEYHYASLPVETQRALGFEPVFPGGEPPLPASSSESVELSEGRFRPHKLHKRQLTSVILAVDAFFERIGVKPTAEMKADMIVAIYSAVAEGKELDEPASVAALEELFKNLR